MIVRQLKELKQSGRFAEKEGSWSSARYLLRDDGVGFTMTQTTVAAGRSMDMQYKNHVEANLIIEGTARLTELDTGRTHELQAGSMYTLDEHDRHRLEALTDLRIVCVFTACAYRQGDPRRGWILSDLVDQPAIAPRPRDPSSTPGHRAWLLCTPVKR